MRYCNTIALLIDDLKTVLYENFSSFYEPNVLTQKHFYKIDYLQKKEDFSFELARGIFHLSISTCSKFLNFFYCYIFSSKKENMLNEYIFISVTQQEIEKKI